MWIVSVTVLLWMSSKFQPNEALQLQNQSLQRSVLLNKYRSRSSMSSLYAEKYGKGAEIYPITNEIPFTLADSFPNGVIPSSVQSIIDATNTNQQQETKKNPIGNILKSAAQSESTTITTFIDQNPINKPPIIISFLLLMTGLVQPVHILTVAFFSSYLIALSFLSSSPKSFENLNPIVRSLPPTGHVPSFVSDPLGTSISNSRVYGLWLRLGMLMGYIAPILYLMKSIYLSPALGRARDTILLYPSIIASNLFLLSCQITSENISRKILTPLPIRILIPILYNSIRVILLYQWLSLGWSTMGYIGKALSVFNFIYWNINLFGFLIPVAGMKYMRSYFFGVEAEEVVVRGGDEDNIGLLGSTKIVN